MQSLAFNKKEFNHQNFIELNLSVEEIVNIVFDNCSFESCNFTNSAFLQCKFSDCKFLKCNLDLLNVRNSLFIGTHFEDCKIIGVDWTQAYWRDLSLNVPLSFNRCQLSFSSFYGLNLSGTIFTHCRAHDVDFREANFSKTDFTKSDFKNSLFGRTNINTANFNNAVNFDINILNNNVKGARFCRFEAVRLLEVIGINLID